jgi:hypothetical protein
MSELVLSASSVSSFESCHYRWYLQYVENHAGQQSVPSAIGMGVHVAAEHYYKAALTGDETSMEELQDVFDTTFWFEMEAVTEADPDFPKPVKARDIGRRSMVTYIEDVASRIIPQHVELPGRIDVNGIPYSFHIDLTDSDDIVHDTKVKKSKPRDPEEWAFAATGYALGFRAETGRVEKDVIYDVIIRLKRDRPYHVPYKNGGPVTDTAIGIFAHQLELVADSIEGGDYRPTGLEKEPWVCRMCPVRHLCEYRGDE